MITVNKVEGKDESWYEVHLIHPLTNEQVLESDGFPTIDDVAQFVSDLGSAITGAYMAPEDIKEGLVVK